MKYVHHGILVLLGFLCLADSSVAQMPKDRLSTKQVDQQLHEYITTLNIELAAEFQIAESDSSESKLIKSRIKLLASAFRRAKKMVTAGSHERDYFGSFLESYFLDFSKELLGAKLELAISGKKRFEYLASHLKVIDLLVSGALAKKRTGVTDAFELPRIAAYREKLKLMLLRAGKADSTLGQRPESDRLSTEKVDKELYEYIKNHNQIFKFADEFRISGDDSSEVKLIKKRLLLLDSEFRYLTRMIKLGEYPIPEFEDAYFDVNTELLESKMQLASSKEKVVEFISSHLRLIDQLLARARVGVGIRPKEQIPIAVYREKLKLMLLRAENAGSTIHQKPEDRLFTEQVDKELNDSYSENYGSDVNKYQNYAAMNLQAKVDSGDLDKGEAKLIWRKIQLLAPEYFRLKSSIEKNPLMPFEYPVLEFAKDFLDAELELAISEQKKVECITSHLKIIDQLVVRSLSMHRAVPGGLGVLELQRFAAYREKVKLQLLRAKNEK